MRVRGGKHEKILDGEKRSRRTPDSYKGGCGIRHRVVVLLVPIAGYDFGQPLQFIGLYLLVPSKLVWRKSDVDKGERFASMNSPLLSKTLYDSC